MKWNRYFNLVSGGPSRIHLTKEDLIPDSPVVTVNRAIDITERGIHVDFAMFADSPMSLVKELGVGKYLIPPLQIWVPRPAIFPESGVLQHFDMVSQWEPHLPMSVGMRVTPFGLVAGLDGQLRHQFAVRGALERMMMFKPSKIRILCADMVGSWAQGLSEEECEIQQGKLAQHKRNLKLAQERVEKSGGEDKAALVMRDTLVTAVCEAQQDPKALKFERWAHERNALKEFVKSAAERSCEVEFRTPAKAVIA